VLIKTVYILFVLIFQIYQKLENRKK